MSWDVKLTKCKSCNKLNPRTSLDIKHGEDICLDCLAMFESAQSHHDLSTVSFYLSRHPEILDDLTPPERSEIARHMRSTEA